MRFETLTLRSDMTGPDRSWAARYQPGNVVEYTTGSKQLGIERGSSAVVLATNARENTVTVERSDGQTVTYDPARLSAFSPRSLADWPMRVTPPRFLRTVLIDASAPSRSCLFFIEEKISSMRMCFGTPRLAGS